MIKGTKIGTIIVMLILLSVLSVGCTEENGGDDATENEILDTEIEIVFKNTLNYDVEVVVMIDGEYEGTVTIKSGYTQKATSKVPYASHQVDIASIDGAYSEVKYVLNGQSVIFEIRNN